MEYVATLIEEAWEHHRRRYRSLGTAVFAATAIAALAVVMSAQRPGSIARIPTSIPPDIVTVEPSAVLSKPPYLGVSCPVANSIACDRVGLAVWLKRPAVSVTATIDGAHLPLNRYGVGAANAPIPRRQFSGFLQPAGIASRLHVRPVDGHVNTTGQGHAQVSVAPQMWLGQSAPAPNVQLTIHTTSGQTLTTHLRVGLYAGWG